ncbi:MAG TPA: hypothetical protein ENJ40_07190 [Thermosulfurimonas dismutans]|uniref:Magnesium transporter MgtE intracellular domain-containing protein n=1 Tax=Thermosulfurimonas dismutans TaxID=999894 RepID=A0A7C3GUP9_9BACT|nr:hypothetical protein [Thermosulfurimonas dismutans]
MIGRKKPSPSRLLVLILLLALVKFFLSLGTLLDLYLNPAEVRAEEKTAAAPQCPPEIFEALRIEREKLEERAKQLTLREKRLRLLDQQVERRLAALLELENSVDEKLKKIRTIETKRFKLLVKAYSEMRPSKAARLLMNMDQDMAVKILSAMKSDQVARILAAMPPEKAAPLAEALSGISPQKF